MKNITLNGIFFVLIQLFLPVADANTITIQVVPKYLHSSKVIDGALVAPTIEEARKLLAKRSDITPDTVINVLFAPGVHKGDAVAWNLNLEGARVNFEPLEGAVIFDGTGSRLPTFFTARIPKKDGTNKIDSNLTFKGFTIKNYCQGINLAGDPSSTKFADLQNNTVEQVKFINIGSKYDPTSKQNKPVGRCVAALRLVHASHTTIADNQFVNIINLEKVQTFLGRYGPEHLHAIYLADSSDSNKITGNTFEEFSGSPIRIRNASNNTLIEKNTFKASSYFTSDHGAVSQWYCDPQAKKPCKNKAENPSTNIIIQNNSIDGKLHKYKNIPHQQ